MRRPIALIVSIIGISGWSVLAAIEVKLPEERSRLADSSLPGAALAATLCYTCHSAEYVIYQPPASTRTYWANTVIKMQKTFGAPIPDSSIQPLTDFLVKTYGDERAKTND